MTTKNKMQLKIPAKSINEGFARSAVAMFASQLDPTLDEINDIKTIISEAVTNAIVHAYDEKIGQIYITAKIYEESLIEIIIKDRGKGIDDIKKAMEPMFTTGGEERSGMGFTIMESFATKLKVSSKIGFGTTVKITKKFKER